MLGFEFFSPENSALLFLHLLSLSVLLSICLPQFLSLCTCMHYVCSAEHAVFPWGVFFKVDILGTSHVFKIQPKGIT